MYYFVRHGETDLNKERIINTFDTPINENGKAQAAKTAVFFKDRNITKIYASDTLRTMQSAEIINEIAGLRLDIQPDARLREISAGALEGKGKQDDLKELYKEPEKHGLETLESVFNRTRSFLDSIKTNEDIIVVCHGGIMHMFDYIYLEKEFNLKRFIELFSRINPKGYSNFHILELDFTAGD